jgi:hypothetical protein
MYFRNALCIDMINISYLPAPIKALPSASTPVTPSPSKKRRLGATCITPSSTQVETLQDPNSPTPKRVGTKPKKG